MRLMAELALTGLDKVSHRWFPADKRTGAYGILRFGESLRGMDVYLDSPADIDAVIAELAALRAKMTGEPMPPAAAYTAEPMPPASGICPECGETRGWHRATCDVPLTQHAEHAKAAS